MTFNDKQPVIQEVLYDADGNPVKVVKEGNSYFITTRDEELLCVMKKILKELKTIRIGVEWLLDEKDLETLVDNDE